MLQFGDPLVLRVSSIQVVGGRWACSLPTRTRPGRAFLPERLENVVLLHAQKAENTAVH